MKANYKIELVTDTVILITDLDQYGQVSLQDSKKMLEQKLILIRE